jgi:spore coat polysaccharide biosynthesis protein SpsF
MTKITAIIQARMGSSRLPGKVVEDICGKPMIEQMLLRLRRSSVLDQIVVAIPRDPSDDVLAALLHALKIPLFRGSTNDVLSRYFETAKAFNAEIIVRLTADCPLIDPDLVDSVVREHFKSGADYTSNSLKRTFPRGFDTEVFSFAALERSYRAATETFEREHVTPYMYLNPHLFTLHSVQASGKINRPDLRLTVDTAVDLTLIRIIYCLLGTKGAFFGAEQIIDLFEGCPTLTKINAHVKQKGLRTRL